MASAVRPAVLLGGLKIHVVYTSDERQVVNRVVFDESAILGHTK